MCVGLYVRLIIPISKKTFSPVTVHFHAPLATSWPTDRAESLPVIVWRDGRKPVVCGARKGNSTGDTLTIVRLRGPIQRTIKESGPLLVKWGAVKQLPTSIAKCVRENTMGWLSAASGSDARKRKFVRETFRWTFKYNIVKCTFGYIKLL